MTCVKSNPIRQTRMKPLAACLLGAFALHVSSALPSPIDRGLLRSAAGVVRSQRSLGLQLPLRPSSRNQQASRKCCSPNAPSVVNCNDAGVGSLREAVANAMEGDVIDLS